MSDPLRPVPLQELQHQAEGLRWEVNQPLAELASLTPVRGQLRAVHRGTVLEVEGEAATIVTLCCDRCLQHYNHPLCAQARELIWIGQGPPPGEPTREITAAGVGPELVVDLEPGGLSESLDPRGSFDPERWLFEQLSLQLPLVNRCGPACPGPPAYRNPAPAPAGGPAGAAADPRWAALAALLQPAEGPSAPPPQPPALEPPPP